MFSPDIIRDLSPIQLSIYNYLLDNKEKVAYMKIREFAHESHVSTTSILKFCQKLGFYSYTEFRMAFRQYLQEDKKQSLLTNDTSEIIDFLKRSDSVEFNQQINEITKSILEAKQTIFIGSGNSGVMAKYGARFLSSIGELTLYIDDPHYPIKGNLFSDSVVIICSVSGESNDIITHINSFKSKNCTIISITNNQSSTISKMSDINLSYYISQNKNDRYDITSQIPVISIIEKIGRKLYQLKSEEEVPI